MAEARVGYREYSGDPIALCVALGGCLEGCAYEVSLWGGLGGVSLRGIVLFLSTTVFESIAKIKIKRATHTSGEFTVQIVYLLHLHVLFNKVSI